MRVPREPGPCQTGFEVLLEVCTSLSSSGCFLFPHTHKHAFKLKLGLKAEPIRARVELSEARTGSPGLPAPLTRFGGRASPTGTPPESPGPRRGQRPPRQGSDGRTSGTAGGQRGWGVGIPGKDNGMLQRGGTGGGGGGLTAGRLRHGGHGRLTHGARPWLLQTRTLTDSFGDKVKFESRWSSS